MASDNFPKWDYKEYPKTLSPDDLWGQVRRTVYGKPVSEDQIQMMVDAIVDGLALRPRDSLLDIGCGNAALSARIFPYCESVLGVDFSEYLISVANTRFAGPRHTFVCQDAVRYVIEEQDPLRFDKGLCFGMFSYLSNEDAGRLLGTLHDRFRKMQSVLIGNIPDLDRAANFYNGPCPPEAELVNPQSQIGVWRSKMDMTRMAEQTGWHIRFQDMASGFYQLHYRYNAILLRAD